MTSALVYLSNLGLEVGHWVGINKKHKIFQNLKLLSVSVAGVSGSCVVSVSSYGG